MSFTLSVVIPNYNNGKYISQCLDSILSQSYKEVVEIIIVDDCSSDNSKEILGQYEKKYPVIRPIFLEKNGKVSAARNKGLSIAKGEYITFIDADDCYYNKDKLKNEMEIIKKFSEKGKDVIAYSSIVSMSNSGENYKFPNYDVEKYLTGDIYSDLVVDLKSGLAMRDYCIKTSILKEIGGYNVNNSLFEDFELILKIAKKYEFYFTKEYGTAYRDSINGLSKKPSDQLRKAKNKIIKESLKDIPMSKKIGTILKRAMVQLLKQVYYIIRNK